MDSQTLEALEMASLLEQLNKVREEVVSLTHKRRELDKVLEHIGPLTKDAFKSVREITKEQLDEIRTLRRPPQLVKRALEAVYIVLRCNLLGNRQEDLQNLNWRDITLLLVGDDFIPAVMGYEYSKLLEYPSVLEHLGQNYFGIEKGDELDVPKFMDSSLNRTILLEQIKQRKTLRRKSLQLSRLDSLVPGSGEVGSPMNLLRNRRNSYISGSLRRSSLVVSSPNAPPLDYSLNDYVDPNQLDPSLPMTVPAVSYANKTCGVLFKWCLSQIQLANIFKVHGPVLKNVSQLDSQIEESAKLEAEIRRKMASLTLYGSLKREKMVEETNARKLIENREQNEIESLLQLLTSGLDQIKKKENEETKLRKNSLAVLSDKSNLDCTQMENIYYGIGQVKPNATHSKVIGSVAGFMERHRDIKVRVQGNRVFNEPDDFGTQRSQAIVEELVNQGIEKGRLEVNSGTINSRSVQFHVIQEIIIKERIEFDGGSSSIRNTCLPILDDVFDIIQKNQTLKIRIEGHTCSEGPSEWNKILSFHRAEAVRHYLVNKGVSEPRLTAVGFGFSRPLKDNTTWGGRNANRRVEFIVVDS